MNHLLSYCHFGLLSELTMWGECDNRRPNIHHLSCNSSLSAQEGEVWANWKETWCFVHREVYIELVSRKFIRKILIPHEGKREKKKRKKKKANFTVVFIRCNANPDIMLLPWPVLTYFVHISHLKMPLGKFCLTTYSNWGRFKSMIFFE